MDVFALRNQLIGDYAEYIRSFITIRDPHIRRYVDSELERGLLWPEPLLQLNPGFEPGPTMDQLVNQGVLHEACRRIFRIKDPQQPEERDERGLPGKILRLHWHQVEAIYAAQSGDHYVLTTGTGSGKSLAYIAPIVDHVLRRGSGRGIQAIVVYPMNALANSQAGELQKFLGLGNDGADPPVTFRRYTGQEEEDERQQILAHPPDILLTNYVMLELLLTRVHDRPLIRAARGLRFLVLDELHTYRGRQGADVAMLVRRVREATASPHMQCIGTSATLAEGGTFAEQQASIAAVASRLFGGLVRPQRVIGETLRRITPELDFSDPAVRTELTSRVADPARQPPADYASFLADPLSSWIESTLGLIAEPGTGPLRRAAPCSITGPDGAAHHLSELTGVPEDRCRRAIEQSLLNGYDIEHPETHFPVIAFRLHQFISRGDTVYVSLEDPGAGYITTNGQQFVPGDRSRVLLPLAFCRECGQEYYVVSRQAGRQGQPGKVVPRDLGDLVGEEDEQSGFLYRSLDNPWIDDPLDLDRVPEDWVEVDRGEACIKRDKCRRLPVPLSLDPSGAEAADGIPYHFLPAPFAFCLNCGVAYSSRDRSDFGKLSSLSSEGRSTATTVLSLSTVQALRSAALRAGGNPLPENARKLLSFTDNRQDASLQAGHFNDFVEVGLLRSALYRAVSAAGAEGLSHELLAQRVFDVLGLDLEHYAADPGVKFAARNDTFRALREVLGYRLYRDLKRGWRVTAPNLEQCGLLRIEYSSLDELCAAEEEWQRGHPALALASPEQRAYVARTLLDFLRRSLAIRVQYLDPAYQEQIKQLSNQRLADPWRIDENERLEQSMTAFPRPSRPNERGPLVFVSARGGFGMFLRRPGLFPELDHTLNLEDSARIIQDLFRVLAVAGLVEAVAEPDRPEDPPGYQVPAAALIWRAGDGRRPYHDPIRVPRTSQGGGRANPFFVGFYRNTGLHIQGIVAHEHTAQVPSAVRQRREGEFRTARLPILFCSPTMELGVDIAQLNAVNLRNVPPTPANYAQRSGRAGRQGQPALVFTYCSTGSPHDQYFFRRPERMVRGSVAPPRIDLANEDLVRAHVHAIWLAETDLSLKQSLKDLLDLSGESPSLALLPSVQAAVSDAAARRRTLERARRIFDTIGEELEAADWYTDAWLEDIVARIEEDFNAACERWRGLYRAASRQYHQQVKVSVDPSRSQRDREEARRLRDEAQSQLDLLTGSEAVMESDFYSYRYFAGEGFLPGYSFPRLPLSAYIPGRRLRGQRDEFLSRPRFLAISEFGPRSIIYHEGSRYVIDKVILPVGEDLLTTRAKLCPDCGYLAPILGGDPGPDLCEQCGAPLGPEMRSLFRLQNVVTRRRDRINSDEEERTRQGFEILTAVRFVERGDRPARRVAKVRSAAGDEVLRLTYGQAATLWRINLGWRRRRNPDQHGFWLDTERGIWARSQQEEYEQPDETAEPQRRRDLVIPFVEDHRNCLLVEPSERLPLEVMASLQPALKNAIQVRYQLEDNELAAEPLPDRDDRRLILLYEAAEGGAGVLRQLIDDAEAIRAVARTALDLCHYQPESGEDLRHHPRSQEDCTAACYDCLMSYTNQLDHELLDRARIRDFLLALRDSMLESSPSGAPRADHLAELLALCDSDLERDWLRFLEAHHLRLPDRAQHLLADFHTRPDFLYTDHALAVYIDGPDHDFADVAAHDRQVTTMLQNAGYTVVRFRHDQRGQWADICRQHVYAFGREG